MDTGGMTLRGLTRTPETRRPLIGVTTSELRKAETVSPTPEGEPPRHEMALGLTYMKAVEVAGGIPVVIPPMEIGLIGALLDHLDGVCLSGGPDIHPDHYGQEPHEQLGPTAPDLDFFELEIASKADQAGLPMLAICYGQQLLCDVLGGKVGELATGAPFDVSSSTNALINADGDPTFDVVFTGTPPSGAAPIRAVTMATQVT